MTIAILATLFAVMPIQNVAWITIALLGGSAVGIPMAVFMPMTAMPQRIALSHAFGALAAALVGTAEFYLSQGWLVRTLDPGDGVVVTHSYS